MPQAFLIEDESGSGRVEFVGNRTECALLMLMRGWGMDYNEVRAQHAPDLVKVRVGCGGMDQRQEEITN